VPGGVPAGTRLWGAGRRWLVGRPLRRPRLIPRWIALGAGMAASALFLTLAEGHPALEHGQGPHHRAVQPGTLRAGGDPGSAVQLQPPGPHAPGQSLGGLAPAPPHAALTRPGTSRHSPPRPHRPARPAR
jgi:hypothetical protein